MPDASHYYGSDFALSAAGDLLLASGDEYSKQRILRRLLTVMQDYPWQPDYGAGVPQRVGGVPDAPELTALITGQMRLEDGVSQDVPPVIDLVAIPNGVSCSIQYASQDGDPQHLSFEVAP